MKVTATENPEVLLIEPDVFRDPRGFFMETFHANKFRLQGLPETFVQDNHSRSTRGCAAWPALPAGASAGKTRARGERRGARRGGRYPQGVRHFSASGPAPSSRKRI